MPRSAAGVVSLQLLGKLACSDGTNGQTAKAVADQMRENSWRLSQNATVSISAEGIEPEEFLLSLSIGAIPAQQIQSFRVGNNSTINRSMEPNARQLLTEYLGNDLSKIAMEVDKLMINLPAGTQITSDHIQKYIGISKEYNNFELQAAIGQRNALKANRIINYFASNPKDNPLVMTIALLGGYFTKILAYHYLPDKSQNNVAATLKVNPYFVKDYTLAASNFSPEKTMDIISLLRQYDLRSKGFDGNSTDEGELLKEIVFKIIH